MGHVEGCFFFILLGGGGGGLQKVVPLQKGNRMFYPGLPYGSGPLNSTR